MYVSPARLSVSFYGSVALVAFAVNASFLYLGIEGDFLWIVAPLPPKYILVSPLNMTLFIRFKTDSPFHQVVTPSSLCRYLTMNPAAAKKKKKVLKTDSHFSGVDLF